MKNWKPEWDEAVGKVILLHGSWVLICRSYDNVTSEGEYNLINIVLQPYDKHPTGLIDNADNFGEGNLNNEGLYQAYIAVKDKYPNKIYDMQFLTSFFDKLEEGNKDEPF